MRTVVVASRHPPAVHVLLRATSNASLQISTAVTFREQKHRSASELHSCSVLLSLPCCDSAVVRCGDACAPKLPAQHGVMAWARAPAQGSSKPCELDPVASGLLIRRCVRELRVAGFCSALCNRILGRRGEAWCEPAVPATAASLFVLI